MKLYYIQDSGRLQPYPEIIYLCGTRVTVSNALAYYGTKLMTAMKCFMVLPLLTGEDLCGHRSLLCSSAAVHTIPSNQFRMKRTVANALGICLEKIVFRHWCSNKI